MSSEQFSEQPMPAPEGKPCKQCGAQMSAGVAEVCARCLEQHAIQEGLPHPRPDAGAMPDLRAGVIGDDGGWAVLGVLAVLVCVGLAFSVPGILVILLIVATPAVIRTLMESARRNEETAVAMRRNEKTAVAILPSLLQIFFSSIGVATAVGIAATIAFTTICFGVGCVGIGMAGSLESERAQIAAIAAIAAGSIAGLVVGGILLRRLWSRKE